MCCVMPPASPGDAGAADVVEQRGLAVVDVAHDGDHRRTAARAHVLVLGRTVVEEGIRIVQLGGDRRVAPISSTMIIAVSWSSTWLMVTIEPIFISALMTSVALIAILCARSATEIVSGTWTSRTTGSVGAWNSVRLHPAAATGSLAVLAATLATAPRFQAGIIPRRLDAAAFLRASFQEPFLSSTLLVVLAPASRP